jgi:hypothetical protein
MRYKVGASVARMEALKKMVLLSLALSFVLCEASLPARAQTAAAVEAKAMLERAVAELKADQEKALAQFNARTGVFFKDGKPSVFCFDMASGRITAHPALIGKDVRALSRMGPEFGEQIFSTVKEGTILTVDYMDIPPPGGREPVPRQSFVTRIGDQGCGVGYPW